MPDHLTVSPGEGVRFRIADLAVRLSSELPPGRDFLLPSSFGRFRFRAEPKLDDGLVDDVKATIRATASLQPMTVADAQPVFDSTLHWRCLRVSRGILFEMFHPPSGDVYCQAETGEDFTEATVLFNQGAMERLSQLPTATPQAGWFFPYPMDHLLFVPRLARARGFLLHACGAVVDGRALIFAGHSGDGKTTLSRLLAQEGIELLSDERIALRRHDHGFLAYGTPWPGEGEVVSTEHYPLGGLFILRKTCKHLVRELPPVTMAAELLARAIVPYYLPETTNAILALLEELAAEVPMRELGFALDGGLSRLLGELLRQE